MAKITCCKNCTERHENCHAECKEYKDQKRALHNRPDNTEYAEYYQSQHNKIAHHEHRVHPNGKKWR